MANYNHAREEDSCKTSISIDITKIVKYSCISSVLIVFIVFASNVIKSFQQE